MEISQGDREIPLIRRNDFDEHGIPHTDAHYPLPRITKSFARPHHAVPVGGKRNPTRTVRLQEGVR
jgi:hypothetical protein